MMLLKWLREKTLVPFYICALAVTQFYIHSLKQT